MTARERSDNGSDQWIVSPKLADAAVFNGNGKFKKIPLILLQLALKDSEEKKSFTLSRIWTPLHATLFLTAGPLLLANVSYLVTNAELAVEDLLLGLPVLQHLRVDTKLLSEERRDLLDGTDCSHIESSSTRGGQVSRRMIARLNGLSIENTTYVSLSNDGLQRVNYFQVNTKQDPCQDSSLPDPPDFALSSEVEGETAHMVQVAIENGLPIKALGELQIIISEQSIIFTTSFSSGPAANVALLKVDLFHNAKPVEVRIRN